MRRDRHPAIGSLVDEFNKSLRIIAFCGLQLIAHEGVARHVRTPQKRKHRVEHGNLHVAAFAGPGARQ